MAPVSAAASLTPLGDRGLSGSPPLASVGCSASRAPYPSAPWGPAATPGASSPGLQAPCPLVHLLQGLSPSRSGQWGCSRRAGSWATNGQWVELSWLLPSLMKAQIWTQQCCPYINACSLWTQHYNIPHSQHSQQAAPSSSQEEDQNGQAGPKQ